MSAACVAPCCGTDLEVRFVAVHDSCYRKIRHRFRLFYQLDVCTDQTEVIAHVNHGYLDAIAGHTIEDQSGRIFLTADSKRQYIDLRFGCCKCRRNLQHMGCKLKLLALG